MGNLKPGAVYTYTQRNGITYAEEFGSNENIAVGWKWDNRTSDGRPLHDHIMDDKLWGDIRRESKTNPALHNALERVKIIYYLSKDKDNINHHPV